MDLLVAALLGVVQGVTEFLPVSSDGHLAFVAPLLGVDDMPLAMVVIVHGGTFLATLTVFGKDVWRLLVATVRGLAKPKAFFGTEEGRVVAGLVVATIPTAVIGLLLETAVEAWSHVLWIVGVCLLGSAGAVLATRVGDRGTAESLSLDRCFLVGLAQGAAVLPGLSRSGMTIATAMLLGMAPVAAFRFSFLLSLPAVFGAIVLELPDLAGGPLVEPAVVASVVAFVTGCVALHLLRNIVVHGRFWAFAIYLVPLGAGLIVWDLVK